MSGRTIEASIDAWLPDGTAISAAQLLTMEARPLVNAFAYSIHDMAPWAKVGVARITVEIEDVDGFVDTQIDALKEARQKVLADAQMKATEIDRKIQSLLAIEHDTTKSSGPCWRCNGSGDMVVTAGSGPNTWTETAVCSQCGGTGEKQQSEVAA